MSEYARSSTNKWWQEWSNVEIMSISTVELRFGRTVTRSSSGNACALRSVKQSA